MTGPIASPEVVAALDELLRRVGGAPPPGAESNGGTSVGADPGYPRPEDTLQIAYALPALNGTAMLRPLPDHMAALRLNVTTDDAERVRDGLRALTTAVEEVLWGLDRPRHSTRDPVDEAAQRATAFVGFGVTFFRARGTDRPRFDLPAEPRHLAPLRLRGDAEAGVDPDASQADLLVTLESTSFALLVDGVDHLTRHARESGWLEVVDCRLGATRGDARNHQGFLDGVRNPSPISRPSAAEVAMTTPDDDAPALESGSYLVLRRYAFDMDAWDAQSPEEQERIVGARRNGRGDLVPLPEGSHVRNAYTGSAPAIFRRGMSYAELQDDGAERGLLFLSFQRRPEAFVRLHDEFLFGPGGGEVDRLVSGGFVTPTTADLYFVPDHLGWGWVGQPFFEPDAFEQLYAGGALARDAELEPAIATYQDLCRRRPDFLPAFSNLSDLAPDADLYDLTEEAADAALRVDPRHFLSLGVKAWSEYLRGDYTSATAYARRTVEATYVDAMRAYPYHTLGASLLELGRPDEAEGALRRGVARASIEPLLCFSLGNALDAQGRTADADKIYARTLEVVEYRLRHGMVRARDRRSTFNMRFIHYRTERSERLLAAARALLRGAPNIRPSTKEAS